MNSGKRPRKPSVAPVESREWTIAWMPATIPSGAICGGDSDSSAGAEIGLGVEPVDQRAEPDFGRGVSGEVHAAGPEALARRAEAMKRAADFIDLARVETDESLSLIH